MTGRGEDWSPGRAVGRYVVEGLSWQDGVSREYAASDPLLRRKVVLRVYADTLASTLGASPARLEAQRHGWLVHPGMRALHDLLEHDGREVLVLEHVEGAGLEDLVRAGPMDPVRAARLVSSLASILGFLHRRGLVHCAVSDGYVLVDTSGEVRLRGHAISHREGGDPTVPEGSAIGAPPYMAPEQWTGRSVGFGPRTDVWALGVVLYELLAGRKPFPLERDSFRRLIEAVRAAAPPPLAAHGVAVDPALEAICRRCLSARPEERFANGTEVEHALRAWVEAREGRDRPARVGPVFVSFSHQDVAAVERRIVGPLEQHGIPTWYSKERISGADEWERSIREGLESSPWFSVALSPRAIASRWVRAEVHWALSHREGRVLPVLLEPCDPGALHLMLPTIQHVDLTADDAGARRLLAALAR